MPVTAVHFAIILLYQVGICSACSFCGTILYCLRLAPSTSGPSRAHLDPISESSRQVRQHQRLCTPPLASNRPRFTFLHHHEFLSRYRNSIA
jgi:hypothetical protein